MQPIHNKSADLHKSSQITLKGKLVSKNNSFEKRPSYFSRSPKAARLKVFRKIDPLFVTFDKTQIKESFNPKVLKSKYQLYSEVIKGLLSMSPGSKEVSGTCLLDLFLDLGYSSDSKTLELVLRAACSNPFLCSFSKSDLKSFLFEDKQESSFLTILKELKDLKDLKKPPGQNFDSYIKLLKRWWAQICSAKNGFAPSEAVCNFLVKISVFSSSSEVKKAFEKISQYMNFSQFLGIFSRGLFKFLLLSLCEDFIGQKVVPADIELNALRRERMLNTLSSLNSLTPKSSINESTVIDRLNPKGKR
jgi:hypothetical protein